jgi:hypothetical protein
MIIDISERSKEAMRNAVKSEEWIRLPVGVNLHIKYKNEKSRKSP